LNNNIVRDAINEGGFYKNVQRFCIKTILAKRTDIILFCFLIMASMKFVSSIETSMDIGLADESYFLHNGVKLIENGLPSAQWAPLYAIWYYLLSSLEKDTINLFYLNYKILIFLTTLALYICLRRIKVNPYVSIISSFFYLISVIPQLFVHCLLFALLILLLFLIFTTFARSEEEHHFLLGIGILLLSLVRPEYFISFLLFCLVFLYFILQKIKAGLIKYNSGLLIMFSFSAIVFLQLYFFGNPLHGDRSWLAFGMNFSRNFVRWHNLSINPWSNWEQITKSVFGDANSIISAATSNSKEFFRHILYNAVGYIKNLIDMPLSALQNLIPVILNKLIRRTELLFIIIIIIHLLRKRHDIKKISDNKVIRHFLLIFVVISIPVMLTALIMTPNYHYLTIQAVIFIIFFSYLISKSITSYTEKKQTRLLTSFLLGVLIFLLTPNRFNGWDIMPMPKMEGKIGLQMKQQDLKTIKFIRALNITEKVNMLEAARGYFVYLGDNYKMITESEKKEKFDNFILNNKVNMIVSDKTLEQDTRFIDDSEFKSFLEKPDRLGFTKIKIPNTEKYLFVKNILLKNNF